MWDVSTLEDKAEFVQMAIKSIEFDYIIDDGPPTSRKHSLKINQIIFINLVWKYAQLSNHGCIPSKVLVHDGIDGTDFGTAFSRKKT